MPRWRISAVVTRPPRVRRTRAAFKPTLPRTAGVDRPARIPSDLIAETAAEGIGQQRLTNHQRARTHALILKQAAAGSTEYSCQRRSAVPRKCVSSFQRIADVGKLNDGAVRRVNSSVSPWSVPASIASLIRLLAPAIYSRASSRRTPAPRIALVNACR